MTTQSSGLSALHLRVHVVEPTLAYLAGADRPALASRAAVELVMGTMAVESGIRALDQITHSGDTTLGPALGLVQMEPATHDDIWVNYLAYQPELRARVNALLAPYPPRTKQLVGNLNYAVAMARLLYWRSPAALAPAGDIAGHAAVWKRIYNTPLGKGREADFVERYRTLVAPYM